MTNCFEHINYIKRKNPEKNISWFVSETAETTSTSRVSFLHRRDNSCAINCSGKSYKYFFTYGQICHLKLIIKTCFKMYLCTGHVFNLQSVMYLIELYCPTVCSYAATAITVVYFKTRRMILNYELERT
jgi:hypothetical protein